MLDRRFIRENSDAVRVAVRVKGINLDVDELLSLDHASRELQRELDGAHTRRKRFSRVPDRYAMAALDLRWLHAPVACGGPTSGCRLTRGDRWYHNKNPGRLRLIPPRFPDLTLKGQ